MRNHPSVLRLAMGAALMITILPAIAAKAESAEPQVQVSTAVAHAVSPRLRFLPLRAQEKTRRQIPLRVTGGLAGNLVQTDPVLQAAAGPAVDTTGALGFPGVGNGDYGFVPNAIPPDTNGAVGATQYVQWVNESLAVFNKADGTLLMGPTAGNTLWSALANTAGAACATNNDGDPIVQYDKAAGRWIMTQFSVSTTPYLQCVAVSQTSDATGAYNLYAFSYGNTQFPDYPKLGVWPDGYYITYNIFNQGVTFAGAKVCAFDRAAMLAGSPLATQQCFQLSNSYGSLLPSDLDGPTLPPASSPDYLLNFGSNALNLWQFHVDWAAPANSKLTGPARVAGVAAFTPACRGGACIPQYGTRQKLDSLADRLMYRLAYRNFGDHEALVVNHSVTADKSVGVRWYEIRSPGATPTVFQQGTYAPDGNFRWMGSIAMDKVGDMALGYSVSSATTHPGIRYTGRVPGDAAGIMQGESAGLTSINLGSQTLYSRWGDYTAMSVDPVDDCTFWYTNEYLKSTGVFNWSTRIASFKFPGCQ